MLISATFGTRMKEPTNKKKVIFYLVDGARPDIIKDLIDKNQLPNIKEHLFDKGSFTKGSTCYPSTTGPAYLPFLTGHHPGMHDITGIRWFDKKQYFAKNRWNRDAMRSYCGYEAKFFNDDMDPEKPSLFEIYPKGYNIYNMVTKGVKEENDLTKKGKTGLYFRAHFYHEHHPVDEAGHERLMESLELDPQFVFAVFPSVDWDSHSYHFNDDKTVEAYKIVDRSLGDVVNRLKEKNEYDDTLIIMVSDHGLSSTKHHLDLGRYFKKKGYRILEYPSIWSIAPNLAVFISGNSFASLSFLDMKDHYYSDALKQKHGAVLDEFVKEDAIDFIIYRNDENSIRLQNNKGEAIININKEGKLSYQLETSDPLELGAIPEPMDTEECFTKTFESKYPDALYQISELMKSDRAGDVVISAAIGYDLREFWEVPEHKGSHGSLHWEHMHVPILTNKKDLISEPVRTTHINKVIREWLDN